VPEPFGTASPALVDEGRSLEAMRRWEAPAVVAFRRKIAPYLFVNGVIVLFALFGSTDLFFFTVLWSIYIAFKYAKLWSDGYDWRDVFRQPRDRELSEVIEEAVEYVRAIFDPRARARLRDARTQRKIAARLTPLARSHPASAVAGRLPHAASSAAPLTGALADRVRQAMADRDEIRRRLNDLPKAQREQLGDVGRSADALADRVQTLALQADEVARQDLDGARAQLESEIRTLENAANPLERGSEDRVRRLAYLKRQRRALIDTGNRREAVAGKLETCALALQNMRFDLMRLGVSPQMHQHITSLANQAMSLAENVDDAVFVANEMGRLGTKRATGSRQTERG
jgi:serine/threonine-protein kinase